MKAVFLDVDGVLCTPLSMAVTDFLRLPPERQLFDPAALFHLRRIARRTGAEMILSSTWRDALYLDDPLCRALIGRLYSRLARNGTPIADATPLIGGKGEEIAAWLTEHPCSRYVVLDDHDCFQEAPEVRAHWIPVPGGRGLRRREADEAIRRLLE